jgi:DNA transformation protein
MAVGRDYLDYVLEQLAGLSRVRPRRMFGGVGLYSDEVFFAIISDDTVYLRVDAASRADFVARGMGAFRPYADRPEISMTYFEVPADVLEDCGSFVAWSRRAVAAALEAAKERPARARNSRRHAKAGRVRG